MVGSLRCRVDARMEGNAIIDNVTGTGPLRANRPAGAMPWQTFVDGFHRDRAGITSDHAPLRARRQHTE
jgi:hypothetical protein